jgi:hypothetical protein
MNRNEDGWSQSTTAIAQSVSTGLLSNQFNVETEFYFYLQNLNTGFTSTMTSTTFGSSTQLVVSFTGNNVFPNSQNPFKYTTQS